MPWIQRILVGEALRQRVHVRSAPGPRPRSIAKGSEAEKHRADEEEPDDIDPLGAGQHLTHTDAEDDEANDRAEDGVEEEASGSKPGHAARRTLATRRQQGGRSTRSWCASTSMGCYPSGSSNVTS